MSTAAVGQFAFDMFILVWMAGTTAGRVRDRFVARLFASKLSQMRKDLDELLDNH